jgi:hypothetical protein
MAHTFTIARQDAVGGMRVLLGTYYCDNATATEIDVGLKYVYGACCCGSQSTGVRFNTSTNGYFGVTTAVTGATHKCIVFGY